MLTGIEHVERLEILEARAKERFSDFSGDCILWTGGVDKANGYGRITIKGVAMFAHRYAYEQAKSQIPEGMVIDHLCRNKLCVNPNHLRAVTRKENTLENSLGITALNTVKTECPYGHQYTPENTYVNRKTGHRRCRTCRSAQRIARYASLGK